MSDKSRKSISFSALQLANEQRSTYGLRYNDFNRYRKHCANRTHRLRSTMNMTHGKGRDFKKLPQITPDNVKEGHLQLLLLEAERAWAYSQELIAQSLANVENAHSLRHSATGRFRRSVNWSTRLLSLCQSLYASSRLSADNLLQVTIYTLILNGRFLRYRDEFEDALIQLSIARHLLDQLADKAGTSRDQALATLFADGIGPEIRHCAHELGRSKAYDVDSIVKELALKHRNEIVDGCDTLIVKLKTEGEASGKSEVRKKLGTIVWEDQPVPVRNPELVDVLLKVQEAETKLALEKGAQGKGDKGMKKNITGSESKKGVAAYDAILLALSDAEDVARKLVEGHQLSGSSPASGPAGTRDIQFVHAYIIYQLLSRRIQRDLLLIGTLISSQRSTPSRVVETSKLQKEQVDSRLYPAVVKLLDTIVQSLGQMRNLSLVDESPDLASAVEARLSFTKARRCQYLALSYAPMKKFAEALTLIQHANIHLRETRSVISTVDSDPITVGNPAYYNLNDNDFAELEKGLSENALCFKNDWFAYNGGSIDADNKSYKKPLFFDIALNYVQLDMDRLQERAGKASTPKSTTAKLEPKLVAKAKAEEIERPATPAIQPSQSSGLSNLLGGWWGRK